MEASSPPPVMSSPFADPHPNLSQEDGGKVGGAEQVAGPDGLLLPPGWVMGAFSCTRDQNGETHFSGTSHPIPMACFLCGAFLDHWATDCPSKSKIRPELSSLE